MFSIERSCMKKKIAAAVAAVLLVVGGAGYAGKAYFDAHYILLDENDVAALQLEVASAQMNAYLYGKAVCEKSM